MATASRLRSGQTRLRRGMPASYGLVGAWDLVGGRGRDIVGTCHLAPSGAASFDGARGLRVGSGAYWQTVLPPYLRLNTVSIVLRAHRASGSPTNANVGGMGTVYALPNGSPFTPWMLSAPANGGVYCFEHAVGGTFTQIGSWSPGVGVNLLVGTLTSGAQRFYSSAPGDPLALRASGSSTGSVSYSATSYIQIGDVNGMFSHEFGLVYNRVLFADEVRSIEARGMDLFARTRGRVVRAALTAGRLVLPGSNVIGSGVY